MSLVTPTRLFSDIDGISRFEDLDPTFTPRDFAPPAPPIDATEPVGAREFLLIRFAAGWSDLAHPAPARQIMLILSGLIEVTAGGETRRFTGGDVCLVEDTVGAGHGTTALEDTTIGVVRL